ncbi:hypothetical protein GCM10010219_52920 [Streptomyces netropsis]|nr:hypothetical protein GCM10010219_52920 [Streptomyces netropsis]
MKRCATSPAAGDLQGKLAEADRQSRLLQQEADLLRDMLAAANKGIDDQDAEPHSLEQPEQPSGSLTTRKSSSEPSTNVLAPGARSP